MRLERSTKGSKPTNRTLALATPLLPNRSVLKSGVLESSHLSVTSSTTGMALSPLALLPILSRVGYHPFGCGIWREVDDAQCNSTRGVVTCFSLALLAIVLAKGIHYIISRKAPLHKISGRHFSWVTMMVPRPMALYTLMMSPLLVIRSALCTLPTFLRH